MRIAVIGYGTGGQASALMLSADGHEVEVFERAPVLGPVGAGFLLQPVGLAVLWELRLLDDAITHGVLIRRLYGETATGRRVMDMRYQELDTRLFGLGMQRGALFELLDAAWQTGRNIRSDTSIVDVDVEAGVLTDARGVRHAGFDLVIIADGAASRLRGKVAPARIDRPYPWGAQWCLVEQSDWPWIDELQQRYVGARRMAGMLPVGSRPGDPVRRLSFFWSVPAAAFDDPEAMRWRDQLKTLWPQAAERLQGIDVPNGLAKARYRDALHRHWFRGRAVLLGDAAHAMSPQLGQGVNMALLDALALRNALRSSEALGVSLAIYEKERRSHVAIYQFWSRWLTPLFQSERDTVARLRDLVFHPMSRLPGGRGQMLRVLSGTRHGWFGSTTLPEGFLHEIARVRDRVGTSKNNRP
ncbi:MAG: NAD(P)/FAD-dependent oxidoreductase [Dokdonella sp.]